MNARIHLDTQHHVGPIDRRLFSGFLEHLGRAVYGGVFDPGNPRSDAAGFRRDVLNALRPMQMPLVRYPGGNFVSNYHWTDGIGPVAERPPRPDFAWRTIETNQFGTDEFAAWCRALGTAPMLAVNLGTAGAKEAAALVEYCNLPGGTYWADRRVANGYRAPHAVPVWCLGNEMDGPWQAGHVPADEYARRAQQAAALMKGLDPKIGVVACGSSGNGMPTYLHWDRTVLEYCWDHIDYLSAHRYSGNRGNSTAWFLAEGIEIDQILDEYAALLRYVRAVKRSRKPVHLSFDEWNVWYRAGAGETVWQIAPPQLEELYNLEDALVCAQYLNSFLRHADTVKIACLAQIVNVIAPVLTRPNGVLLQSIFHPFVMFAEHARGHALEPVITSPLYAAGDRGDVPALDASVSHDEAGKGATAFLVNRDPRRPLTVEIEIADRRLTRIHNASVLTGSDPKLANTWEKPNRVRPAPLTTVKLQAGKATIRLPRLAFAAIRFGVREP